MRLGGNLPPGHDALLYDKWHGIVCVPSRTDTAGPIKVLYLPSHGQQGGGQSAPADLNCRPVGPQLNTPTTRPRYLSNINIGDQYTPGPQRGVFSQIGGSSASWHEASRLGCCKCAAIKRHSFHVRSTIWTQCNYIRKRSYPNTSSNIDPKI